MQCSYKSSSFIGCSIELREGAVLNKNNELKSLLSFAHCIDEEDVQKKAKEIATELILNWKIVTPLSERRFWGLEFYVHIPNDVFEDDAAHCREEQLEAGTFYFHTKSKKKWTPPIFNRHGVDISCGDIGKNIHGGILMRHLGGEGNRDGSGVALRSLVRGDEGFKRIKRGSSEAKWTEEEVSFFKRLNSECIFGCEMYLAYSPLDKKAEVSALPRIGIDGTRYFDKKLRFVRVAN